MRKRIKKDYADASKITKEQAKDPLLGLLSKEDLIKLPEAILPDLDPAAVDLMDADTIKNAFSADKVRKMSDEAKKRVNGKKLKDLIKKKTAAAKDQIKAFLGKDKDAIVGAVVDFIKKHSAYENGESVLEQFKNKLADKGITLKSDPVVVQDSQAIISTNGRRRRLTATSDDNDKETVIRAETSTNAEADSVASSVSSIGTTVTTSIDATDGENKQTVTAGASSTSAPFSLMAAVAVAALFLR
jgi:hypothetical protein